MTKRGIVILAAGALVTCLATTGTAAAAPGFAPYADVNLRNPFPLLKTANKLKLKRITMGFVLAADGKRCEASWGGSDPVSTKYLLKDVQGLRALGGDGIPSFGGQLGEELATVCPDVQSLAAQYQSVIDTYDARRLDFDIEGGGLGNTAAGDRRNDAIALVQQAYPIAHPGKQLEVSFTLPVNPTGMLDESLVLLRSAVARNVKISTVNIMTMDFAPESVSKKGGMGAASIKAAKSVNKQLGKIVGGTKAQRYAMIGITPMIGVNDEVSEVFDIDAMAKVGDFIKQEKIGWLAYWSISRDGPCKGGENFDEAQDSCSGLKQSKGEFTRFFKSSTGAK